MQIFPDQTSAITTSSPADTFSSTLDDWTDNAFDSLFNQEQAMFDEALDSSSSATESILPPAPSLQEDYADPLSSIQVTMEDLAALEEDLRSAGFTDDDMAALRDEIQSKDGISWSEFNSLVNEKMRQRRTGSMDEATEQELMQLFAKLGFSPDESSSLLKKLKNGQGDKVLSALNDKLATLDPRISILMDKSELQTLVKAMGLGPDTQSRLTALLGDQNQAGFTIDGLKKALSLIGQDMLKADKAATQAFEDLRQSMREAMDRAFTREDIERMASRFDSREVARQKVMIKEKAEENYGTSPEDATEVEHVARRLREEGLMGKSRGGHGTGSETGKESASSEKDAWDAMISRIRVVDSSHTTHTPSAAQMMETAARNAISSNQSEPTGRLTPDAAAQRLLQSVNQGLLKDLGQGTKQLVLRLDPPQLGKLSVILSVQNNEVRAILRTDNEDAGRMLNEQMHHIREALEAQGLKVEKLEIQTQLQQERGMDWQGFDQHNMSRDWESQARRMGMSRRMRAQARDEGVVREVQSVSEQAGISRSGIDIIA